MNPVLIIARKRDGQTLRREEIVAFVAGFARGDIPDYQMAALAMAIYLRGMTPEETADLTDAMLASGERLPRNEPAGLGGRPAPRVDKHSSGGIGDKTSLVLAPLLASCGLVVPMISGRGLGATGGTLDKLESIPGFRTNLHLREIDQICQRVGCVITGATAAIAPADRKLYALRDVTATVPSIPLITASIMSKKLAESLDALVLDVKFGSGAFMKSQEDGRRLARSLVETGRRMGVRTAALLTDMNQPLGRMAGNLVEIHEVLAALAGRGPADLWECTRALGAELLVLAGQAPDLTSAAERLDRELASGRPREKFEEMVRAQGGDLEQLPPLGPAHEIGAAANGYVAAVETEQLGLAIIEMGGGRMRMHDWLDLSVGLEMQVRVGDRVERGKPLVRVYAPHEKFERVAGLVAGAFRVAEEPVAPLQLIAGRVGEE